MQEKIKIGDSVSISITSNPIDTNIVTEPNKPEEVKTEKEETKE